MGSSPLVELDVWVGMREISKHEQSCARASAYILRNFRVHTRTGIIIPTPSATQIITRLKNDGLQAQLPELVQDKDATEASTDDQSVDFQVIGIGAGGSAAVGVFFEFGLHVG